MKPIFKRKTFIEKLEEYIERHSPKSSKDSDLEGILLDESEWKEFRKEMVKLGRLQRNDDPAFITWLGGIKIYSPEEYHP